MVANRREEVQGEGGDLIGLGIGPPQHDLLDLEAEKAMRTLRLDREFAELDAIPAKELGRRPRTLAGDVDPDIASDQSCRRREEDRVALGRFLAPCDPDVRILAETKRRH